MPNGREHGRRGLRSWRLGALLLAGVPFCTAFAACAESSGVAIGADTTPPGSTGTVSEASQARCGAGGIECPVGGTGCCPAGNICTPDNTCLPSESCTSNQDCSSDTTCGGRVCRSWSSFPAAAAFDLTCRDGIDLPSLRPEVQCRWPGNTPPTEFPNSVQVIATPMVVDFNFDDDPETRQPSIVFISYEGSLADGKGVLRVIDGRTCALQATISGGDANPFVPEVSPALGDLDRDGRPDIAVVDTERIGTSTRTGVAVYRVAGTEFELISRQTSSLTSRIKGLSIHDVANDNEVPEILTDTGMYFYKDELAGIQEKVNVQGSASEPPIVHDVDGDTIPEMVTARGIFNWDPEALTMAPKKARNLELWNPDQNVDSAAFVGLADLGDFPGTALGRDSAEMVVVSNGQLLVTQVDGRVQLRVQGTGVAGGPPVIADFDADGRMEFASPGLDMITAFDLDCVDDDAVNPNPRNCRNPEGPNRQGILWTKRNARGATSGASVFDFDGDRRSEVVYADQCFMRILDGLTGDVLFSVPRSSITRWDYPVIADADGDGHTEIVTASNDSDPTLNCALQDALNTREAVAFQATHGITVWADADKRWAGSRPIWNQHAYSITNVNDDGTIPVMGSVASQFQRPDENPNSLRQNVQGATGVSLQLPDLTASGDPEVECQAGRSIAKLSVQLCNRGLLEVAPGAARLALAQAEQRTNILCDTTNTMPLRAGRCESITCDVGVPPTAPGLNIAVLADPSSALRECSEGRNNTSIISNVFCPPGIR